MSASALSPGRYLTVAEVAAKLGMTPKAVYVRVTRGEIPHRRWGRKLVFCEAEIDHFLSALPGVSVLGALARQEMG